MILIYLIVFLCISQNTRNFDIQLKIGSSTYENTLSAFIDVAFDHILIGKQAIDCVPEKGCIIKNQNNKNDKYHEKVYNYVDVILSIKLFNYITEQTEMLALDVRLTDIRYNVIGLNSIASWRSNIKDKPYVQLYLNNNEISYVDNKDGSPLSIYQYNSTKVYYIDALFTYTVFIGPFYNIKSQMPSKICFHDKDATQPQNYFFQGNEYFQPDWDSFISNVNRSSFRFEARVSSGDNNESFNFIYDLDVFNNYDKNPMKGYDDKAYEFCDVFLGDFAAHRSTLRILLKYNEKNDRLDASIVTATQPYVNYEGSYFKFFVYVLVFGTLMYMGYMCYQKLNTRTVDARNSRVRYDDYRYIDN